ncbi:TnsD family Tn7-like transposition protein [Pelomonas sp. Root1444]|uniref:TnsD family Tn7-like transposition protein n=1 Tax=Pelomonas sp. Root1444 TaxID=1736464 RepID=UPI0009EA6E95|nr:TnsD family Tn7-like transposition protein [Pelomonas sp. Root1444]
MTKHTSRALFDAPFIDEWRDDETLFSLASRQHVISCRALASDTCRALFGHAQLGSAHDLPSCLDKFVERTGGALGSAESVIRHRTLLPFYLPYRSEGVARNACAAMRGAGIGPLKGQLGMLATRFRAHHPLKACSDCMAQDQAVGGTPHWRLVHQLPSTWICPRHHQMLLRSTVKATGVGRFLWHLPDLKSMVPVSERPPEAAHPIWRQLVTCGEQVLALPNGFHFDDVRLASTYRSAAAEQGLISSIGRLCTATFGEALATAVAPLRAIPELSALPSCPEEAIAQFARLLRPPRTGTHPLRHFAMVIALFGTWESFWAAYCADSKIAVPHHIRGSSAPDLANMASAKVDARRAELLNRIDAGMSVTAAAAFVGIATGTAMAWAAQAAVRVDRRPKLLKPDVRKQVIRALRRGVDKAVIAESCGISIQTVTNTLRTEIGLADAWRGARFTQAMRRARADWAAIAARNPHATYTDIRRMAPATFAWLYRNDRAWLEVQAKKQPPAPRSNHSRVDWDARDRDYAGQVARACLLIAAKTAPKRVTIGALCQAVPDLKPLLSKLDRMPLTGAALKQATRRRRTDEGHQLVMTNSP